jgi:hypothetical protein
MDWEKDHLDGSGWFTDDPSEIEALFPGGQWKTADFGAGDLLFFGMKTLHMSTPNTTERVRTASLRRQTGRLIEAPWLANSGHGASIITPA